MPRYQKFTYSFNCFIILLRDLFIKNPIKLLYAMDRLVKYFLENLTIILCQLLMKN